jgi:ketosteroid isomerase-like protein
MKTNNILRAIFLIVISGIFHPATAQTSSDKVKSEITETLNLWNTTAKNADVDKFMSLFDDTENIMLVGSDSGEIFKGKIQIRGWLGQLFKNNSFSWEMNRIDIDSYANTAWVFVDGSMIVSNKKSGKMRKTPYRFTGIMVKVQDVWKWRLFDGSNPRPE